MKKIYFAIIFCFSLSIGFSQNVLITELADPDNDANARFVELYNASGSDVDLTGWELLRWTNGNTDPQTSGVDLTPIGTLAAGEFAIIANNSDFTTVYGFAPDIVAGTGGAADSNGDDQIALMDASDNIIDIFGVPGEDGSETCHEFEDGRAERKATITAPNAVFDESEWNVWADTAVDGCTSQVNEAQNAPEDFDPGSWIGSGAPPTPSIFVTNPNNGDSFPSGTTSVDVEFSTSNIDLNVAGNQVNITVNGVETQDVSSPYTINTTDGETYNITLDLLESGSPVDSQNLSFAVENPIAGCPEVGSIIITEIMQNPSIASDADGEYFELYNTTEDPIDVNGWTISDAGSDSFTISSSLIINPSAHVVFAVNGDIGTNGGIPEVNYVYSGFTLSNGDDEVIVTCAGGTVIDQVAYDGGPNFPDPNGSSMELAADAYNSTDNDLGSNWGEAVTVFGSGDFGTPGKLSDFTLSTESNTIIYFSIYPNPVTNGVVNIISNSNDIMTISVFDILGKQVLNTTVNNNTVNVSSLNTGVYILKIAQGGKTVTKKLVIK